MRYRDILKLISVSAAMLNLAFTLREMPGEGQESNHLRIRESVHQVCTEEYPDQDYIPEENSVGRLVAGQKVLEYISLKAQPVSAFDETEREILLKITMSEAEGESTTGKALVMRTILNRVCSDEFPDTVSEVVFQERQFSPVMDGRYYTSVPDDDCMSALELVESGWDDSHGALYFENYGADCWHSRNLEFLFQEGNHRFYR